ncbi:TPA: hypothetical protein ACKQCJ_000752 [Stenotrophomonas maltophilia]|uniref:DUF3022 domain-containing protein n=1 Tax=Stenotrophomonas maltophilia TaxID=40324 RepID=A0AB34TMH6_STEMA|nr:hypothetical protein [Stenotrophomonas maltophilia]KOO84172.1 hypothetical protein VL23_13735 [Stenotrophomonas maltophilia]
MAQLANIGSAYQEALKALGEQVARAYREECSEFTVAAGLIQGNTLIAITVTFNHTGAECWVPLDLGGQPWTDERRCQIEDDARRVLGARLLVEHEAAALVATRMEEVLNGYR